MTVSPTLTGTPTDESGPGPSGATPGGSPVRPAPVVIWACATAASIVGIISLLARQQWLGAVCVMPVAAYWAWCVPLAVKRARKLSAEFGSDSGAHVPPDGPIGLGPGWCRRRVALEAGTAPESHRHPMREPVSESLRLDKRPPRRRVGAQQNPELRRMPVRSFRCGVRAPRAMCRVSHGRCPRWRATGGTSGGTRSARIAVSWPGRDP